jgi:hypothetical protein
MDPPDELTCPIARDIMKNPVVMPGGYHYERLAITEALARDPVSPMTRQPMTMAQATINYALKSLINNWLATHPPSLDSNPQVSPDGQAHKIETAQTLQPIHHVELSQFTTRFQNNGETDQVHIRITPKPIENRLPLALIAMIDVSGSMRTNACQTVAGME